MSRRCLLLGICASTISLPVAFADAGPVKALRPAEARVPVAQLVRDLESPEFAVRRRATQALIEYGDDAIPALAKAAKTAGPETAARAVIVLERLYSDLQADEATVDAAETALESLRESKVAVASRMSTQALTDNQDLRERRAVAAIQRLGGIVEYLPDQFQQQFPNGSGRQINFILIGRKWRGGDDGLKYVKRLSSVRNLYVTQSKKFQPVSKKAIAALQRDVPNISIQKRGMACLGVSGSMNGGGAGCYVTLVKPDSAAAKANIRPGDMIVEFAGKQVRDFQTLVDRIADHDPGDKVKVGLLRRGQRTTVTVELAEWKK